MESQWNTVKINLNKMLERRGYSRFESWGEEEEDETHEMMMYMNPPQERVLVFFFHFEKMNIEAIKEFVRNMETHQVCHGVLIYQSAVTASTRKVIENLHDFKIELFEMKELLYDLTQFRYYCVHTRVEPEKAMILKKKFGNTLPSLARNDPVARYFDFQKGNLIKIERKNGTIAYRLIR